MTIREDVTSSGHARLTCGCGATLVRQPWMTDGVWNSRARRFEDGKECRCVPNSPTCATPQKGPQ
jgi:hypothetical protein